MLTGWKGPGCTAQWDESSAPAPLLMHVEAKPGPAHGTPLGRCRQPVCQAQSHQHHSRGLQRGQLAIRLDGRAGWKEEEPTAKHKDSRRWERATRLEEEGERCWPAGRRRWDRWNQQWGKAVLVSQHQAGTAMCAAASFIPKYVQ